jgi:hypothetical protein
MIKDRTWTSLVMYEPTAQQSDGEAQVTSARMFANTSLTFGEGSVRQLLPSQCIVTVAARPDLARPTAQQSDALRQDTPVRMFGSALALGESTARHDPGLCVEASPSPTAASAGDSVPVGWTHRSGRGTRQGSGDAGGAPGHGMSAVGALPRPGTASVLVPLAQV